ncbi:MAG: nucleotide sugar dehydrogenase [Planctomycetes bacterium]|nr:nucleotide sugar dehydrogenase [Planctomycetota bacterium]
MRHVKSSKSSFKTSEPAANRKPPAGYRSWSGPTSNGGNSGAEALRPLDALLKKIRRKEAVVGVIGLGYVGLPLVRLFLSKGFPAIGFDTDRQKIKKLNAGASYIGSVPSPMIARARRERRFEATHEVERLGRADAIVICVPTPLTEDGQPDLSYIRNTAEALAPRLRKGHLVVLESTTYPGTTRDVVRPILEKSQLECGRDFFLAFSPEREDPGNKAHTNENIPKLVGGIDEPSLRAAAALYAGAVARVVTVSSAEIAEAAKLIENIYRCVNIAMVNELKMCFDRMGINVWEVIAAAATKPFGFQPFYPGPGMGGHCIPVDPFYLSWKARQYDFATRFIELAGELNVHMPYYVANRLETALRERGGRVAGSRILILGLAFKKDIDDPRESPAFKVAQILQEKGAIIRYNDPYIPTPPATRHYRKVKLKPIPLSEEALQEHEAVVIITDHSCYDFDWIVKHARLVIDTRNACRDVAHGREKIVLA